MINCLLILASAGKETFQKYRRKNGLGDKFQIKLSLAVRFCYIFASLIITEHFIAIVCECCLLFVITELDSVI